MKVSRMLDRKGYDVVTIGPRNSVAEAVKLLVEKDIGSAVVVDGETIRGILTERDILRLTDRDPSRLGELPVEEAMTSELIVANMDDTVEALMEVMTRNRVRHLPVLEEGRLRGLVSIGDVVNALRRNAEEENQHLRSYVQGTVR